MTGKELLHKLQDTLAEDESLVNMDTPLSVPQLLHLKGWFERVHYDAYYDPKTPCPHSASRWKLKDGLERCGACGRRIEVAVMEAGQ